MNKKVQPVQATSIFFIIGILLLVIAFFIQTNSFISSLLSNAAFVILTVAILNSMWSLLGGEPVSNALAQLDGKVQQSFQSIDEKVQQSFQSIDKKLQQSFQIINDSHATGVIGLSTSEKLSRAQWAERLKNTQQSIDLMGFTLLTWIKTTNFEGEVLKLVQKGVNIRVLMMDESNPHFGGFINNDLAGTSVERTQREANDAKRAFMAVQQKIQANRAINAVGGFEIRTVKKGIISCNYCRADVHMIVVNYLYWQQANGSPLILLQQNENEANLFQAYQDEFEQIWNANR